jgi:tRNA splicing endonuclease
MQWEERILLVRKHYESKGYRAHSGLQFGVELVLYADDPSRVHSDFCVHVVREGKRASIVMCCVYIGHMGRSCV